MGTSGLVPEVKVIGGSKDAQELERPETVLENPGTCRSWVLVFVRLRPLAKKEKEAGFAVLCQDFESAGCLSD